MGGGHEGGGLFVPGDDQLDRRGAQALDDIEIFLAGHPEDTVDTFILERADEKIGSFWHTDAPVQL